MKTPDLGALRDVATISVADKVSMISHASFWPPLNFDFPVGGEKKRKCNASYEAKFPSFGYSRSTCWSYAFVNAEGADDYTELFQQAWAAWLMIKQNIKHFSRFIFHF